MSDRLDEAFAALRDSATDALDGPSRHERAHATRRALLASAATQRRRMVVVRWVLPLAAVLGAGAAWAAATGRLPAVLQTMAPSPVPTAPIGSEEPSAKASAAVPIARPPEVVAGPETALGPTTLETIAPPASRTVPPAPGAPPRAEGSASASASSRVAARTPRAIRDPGGSEARPSAGAEVDLEERTYRVAHDAHFVARDAASALAEWDGYLAKYPKGRFEPEARYNRALALVRLGRRDEARAALLPFAEGKFAGYRQAEARQLVDALR